MAKVIGNMFLPEVRTMINIAEMGSVSITKDMSNNILTVEGNNAMKEINPSELLPALVIDDETIMGDLPTLAKYFCVHYKLCDLV